MLCVEVVRDLGTKEPFPYELDVGAAIARNAQSRGLIVRPIGNLCVLSPALILSRQEIDEIVAILGDAVEATIRDPRGLGIDTRASPYRSARPLEQRRNYFGFDGTARPRIACPRTAGATGSPPHTSYASTASWSSFAPKCRGTLGPLQPET